MCMRILDSKQKWIFETAAAATIIITIKDYDSFVSKQSYHQK